MELGPLSSVTLTTVEKKKIYLDQHNKAIRPATPEVCELVDFKDEFFKTTEFENGSILFDDERSKCAQEIKRQSRIIYKKRFKMEQHKIKERQLIQLQQPPSDAMRIIDAPTGKRRVAH